MNIIGNLDFVRPAAIMEDVPNRPPFRRRRLGKKLARMRVRAKMTLDEAAAALYKTRSALHRIEKGETLVDVHLVKSMMDLYDHYDPDLVDQTQRARERGWWTSFGIENQGYIDVETEASDVREVAALIIPGLLQTPAYMRALFESHRLQRTKRWLENDIKVRQIRQERIIDSENPLRLHAVVGEGALRTVVGSAEIMHDQLGKLVRAARLPNVTLQVVPHEIGVPDGLSTSFILLDFSEPEETGVLFIEYVTGALHVEDEHELREARLTFDHLAAKALSPDASVTLIERVLAG
ncbi:transcriptional regulator with XRE-family HTH domain [Saccharothrix coeruleofusca]|uniref:helix-turn-helix domain-containing protein n=1 Tax=Saccharothrix coeruleofusca TaxID=33919 RepID=UPI0027DD929D|nr:helix-turn-helix transcriptional regulator [Saccharothrix coeruleofusca]MBP2340063.1 transcriptional regulator with XRE-family HTH domain [Saccharothrix coeruleofusca]